MQKKIIKDFFSQMKCSNCDTHFDADSVGVLRNEENYTVVRIECPTCQKNFGLALLGLDKNEMECSLKIDKNYSKNVPFEIDDSEESISYDDVIQAHEFYQNLGTDWMKFIPDDKKETED